MSSKISATGASVKGFGMQVNDDGTASYFAVLKKSSAAQKQRIEKMLKKRKRQRRQKQRKLRKKPKKSVWKRARIRPEMSQMTMMIQ